MLNKDALRDLIPFVQFEKRSNRAKHLIYSYTDGKDVNQPPAHETCEAELNI